MTIEENYNTEADIPREYRHLYTGNTSSGFALITASQAAKAKQFDEVFSQNMPTFKAASRVAKIQIEKLLRENAVLEDNEIYYKEGHSYVRLEGLRMTIKTKLQSLQNDPEFAYLFKTKADSGSSGGKAESRFEQRKHAAGIA